MSDPDATGEPAQALRDDIEKPPQGGSIPGDRTISPISGHLGGGRRGKAVLLAALLFGSGAFLWATWDRGPPPPSPNEEPARQVVPFEPGAALAEQSRPTLANPGPNPPSLTGPEVPALEPGPASAAPAGENPVSAPHGAARAPATVPLLVYSRRSQAEGPGRAGALQVEPVAAANTELDALRQGSQISTLRAGRLPNRNYLILAGAVLPCILRTALDSTAPGFVACIIPTDVYSDNGAVVLLEKGSRLLGEYRSGSLKQGQKRIFVLWTRAVTPGGVNIALSSPAADALGRAGFDGAVDRHFWDRFGGALLLSLVDDAAYAAAGSSDSGQVRLPSDAAAIALEGSAAIGPTLRKPQGGEVSIFVAHDLDFSGVYGLKALP